ncbi:MAG: amidohydrolase family protein [Acetobacteraceae bacterium]
MFRRAFLKASAVSPALLACQGPQPERGPSSIAVSSKWIDVHCHVFNGRDLPIYEFIKKTRLSRANPGDWLISALVAFLAGTLQRRSPSVADELALLDAPLTPASGTVSMAADPAICLKRLRARAGDTNGTAGDPAAEPDGAPVGLFGAPRDRMALMMLDTALRETAIRAPSGSGARVPPPPSDHELEQLGSMIQEHREAGSADRGSMDAGSAGRSGLHPGLGAVLGRYFNWGLMFASTRDSLVGSLASLYPSNASLMLTPAIVDYDAWLGSPDTKPEDQLQVMERIMILRARQGMPVHSFAAFDPWRCLRLRSKGVDSLAQLTTALERGAAIGVKLYPPMGFAPTGNAERDTARHPFPAGLIKLTKGRPGHELDNVLDELLDYCAANGVPVMAHCGPSNAIARNYADLAAPFYWRKALAKKRPHRQELRLNLGHFGGIWDLGPGEPIQRQWAQDIAAVMQDYPNVYADIGYFGAVLHPEQPDVETATVGFIADLANRPGSALRGRLMYGSDWSMIGPEPSSSLYASRAVEALAPVWSGDQQDDLTWRNAARFLGLGRADDTRKRLLQAYATHKVDPAPLWTFDPAV